MLIETKIQSATFHPALANPQILNVNSESDVQTPQSLRAIAALGDERGNVRFTPGGGILFDTPITRDERGRLPNVPVALLRPLWRRLNSAGLLLARAPELAA